ncbi:hypothetical protein TrST_g7078 [Triparma strigata]|uniref:BspA family leucine-rich repeat surface protein n=1 Tax=Triparma strigata TaxID=1606541 RepID=A0A9W7C0L1_9STRA|nr:hypothetical protein TrST_g7078 [Triparma strigata]
MAKRTFSNRNGYNEKITTPTAVDDEGGEKGSVSTLSPPSGVSAHVSSMTVAALKAQLAANFIKYKRKMKKDALASLLVETIEARSKIPRLNEDVQGYISSFLSGFDSLHVASQIARGFRLRAKPRLDAMLKRSDADIKVAAKAWCEDAEAAREIYGHISIWNTSEVTDMSDLFAADVEGAGETAEQFDEDISKWDVSNVTTMAWMFFKAKAFNGDLSSWDVSNVTTMEGMFQYTSAFNGDLSSWNVSNVTTMRAMFSQASFNGNLSSWDVSNVTTMEYMFDEAEAFNGDLSSWSVSNVTTMRYMFYKAKAFNGDLSSWDVSNVATMEYMFYQASAFDKNTIRNWDLSGKETEGMFE